MYSIFAEIGQKFRLVGELHSYDVITIENINSSYKVTYTEEGDKITS